MLPGADVEQRHVLGRVASENGRAEQPPESVVGQAVTDERERVRHLIHIPEIARQVVLERGEGWEALELGEARRHPVPALGQCVVEADEQGVRVFAGIESLARDGRVRRAPILVVGLQSRENLPGCGVHLVEEGARQEERRLRDPKRHFAPDPLAHAVHHQALTLR